MLRSLVGSEMCIRDSYKADQETNQQVGYKVFINPTDKTDKYDFTSAEARISASAYYREWDAQIYKNVSVAKGQLN